MKMKTNLITGGFVYRPDTQHASNTTFITPKGNRRPHRASEGAVFCCNCEEMQLLLLMKYNNQMIP